MRLPQPFQRRPQSPTVAPALRDGRREQRRRQAAGLALIAILILACSIWRAGVAAVFPAGWWRIW